MTRTSWNCVVLAVLMIGSLLLAHAQKTDPALLEKLIKATSSQHTFRRGVPEWIKPPTPEPEKVAARFDPVLAESTELTTEQKEFIKANYSKLALLANSKMLAVVGERAKFDDLLTEFLTETYLKELTQAEMREWLAYFETREGKLVLKAILADPQPTDAENKELLSKFEKTSIGVKFIKIFGEELNTVTQKRMGEVQPAIKAGMQEVLSPTEIKKMFGQFVAENYKKP